MDIDTLAKLQALGLDGSTLVLAAVCWQQSRILSGVRELLGGLSERIAIIDQLLRQPR